MEWLLSDEDVWSPILEYYLKWARNFDPTFGLRSNFSTRCFPCGSYGMPTRWRGCLVAHTWVSAQMGHTFLIRLLDRAQNFPEAVLFGVAMEWLLGDEDVWSPVLEYRLKRAISFDPTVGSCSKFSKCCFPLVSFRMATRWRGCLVGRTWVSVQKGHNFWSDHWIALKFFPEAVLLAVAMEWLLSDEDVWSPILEYCLKQARTFDPTFGSRSNFSTRCFPCGSYGMATRWRGCLVARTWASAQMGHTFLIRLLDRAQNFPEAVLVGVAMEWLLGDEDVWSPVLEYRLKRAISFDSIVGSRLKFSKGCFP